jgi:protein-disulfide isomerase-like protein with CxxC motif
MEGWRRKYDAGAIFVLANLFNLDGALCNILQVRRKFYYEGGDLTKAKFHYEAAALAGLDVARCNLGLVEDESGNMEQAIKY